MNVDVDLEPGWNQLVLKWQIDGMSVVGKTVTNSDGGEIFIVPGPVT